MDERIRQGIHFEAVCAAHPATQTSSRGRHPTTVLNGYFPDAVNVSSVASGLQANLTGA